MKCRCNSVGFKVVNIFWQPLPQDAESPFEASYSVRFCNPSSTRLCGNLQTAQYTLGCTLNATQQLLQQKELQCSIGSQTLFPFNFYFIMEMRNSSGVFVSGRKACRLVTNIQCTKPKNFRLKARGKRNLSVSWEPSPYMGDQTSILCYRIWYASTESKANESVDPKISWASGESPLFYSIYGLNPYTKYTLFIQCSLADCSNGWGALSGPVTAMTEQEVPAKAPVFENWSVFNIGSDKRDITVVWKLPPSNTWNGVPKMFTINFWQVLLQKNDSFIPLPNSSRSLHINSGLATKATLPGLNQFVDYQTDISMCTSEGCGPKSNPWFLKGDMRPDIKTSKSQSGDSSASFPWVYIAAPLAGAVFIVILIVVVYKCARMRQRRRNLPPLNERIRLDPPPSYDDPEDSSSSTRNSYAEILLEFNADIPLEASVRTEQGSGDLDT